ncbi:MAG: hypothetical protein R6U37_05590 [Dehalococcoidia bacterium]
MPLFDVYVAIDFSGARDSAQQKSSIVCAEASQGCEPEVQKDRFTRYEAVLYLLQRILYHNHKGNRVLCGFDFCYSFPRGFWSALTGRAERWPEIVRDLAEGIPKLPPIADKPKPNSKEWARAANKKLAHTFRIEAGPFWGPGFDQSRDPKFPYSQVAFGEYRLTERRGAGFKPIFKVGGSGAVGLQSLCGMPYLHHVRTTCAQQKAPLHCWPFDGWEPEGEEHFLVEWYPALYNEGPKSHESDALSCVNWAMDLDSRDELRQYFVPALSEAEKERAATEGWVLGVL